MEDLLQVIRPVFNNASVLWGANITWLEIVACAMALAMVGFNMQVRPIAWPLAIFSSLLYAALFWNSHLYGEGWLQVAFALMAVWGWRQWLRRGAVVDTAKRQPAHRPVSALSRRGRWATFCALAIAWPATAWFLKTFTDSDVPWWDAFPTAASLIGQWLLGRKYIDNWCVWVVVNAVSVLLFAHKGLWLTALLYAMFLILSFAGWRAWWRLLQRDQGAAV